MSTVNSQINIYASRIKTLQNLTAYTLANGHLPAGAKIPADNIIGGGYF
jgi:hypothetical protein